MPQLDKVTFLSQFFWMTLFFLMIFTFLAFYYFLKENNTIVKMPAFLERRLSVGQFLLGLYLSKLLWKNPILFILKVKLAYFLLAFLSVPDYLLGFIEQAGFGANSVVQLLIEAANFFLPSSAQAEGDSQPHTGTTEGCQDTSKPPIGGGEASDTDNTQTNHGDNSTDNGYLASIDQGENSMNSGYQSLSQEQEETDSNSAAAPMEEQEADSSSQSSSPQTPSLMSSIDDEVRSGSDALSDEKYCYDALPIETPGYDELSTEARQRYNWLESQDIQALQNYVYTYDFVPTRSPEEEAIKDHMLSMYWKQHKQFMAAKERLLNSQP